MGEITCRSMLFAVTLALLLPTAVSRLDAAPGAPQSAPLEPPPTDAPDEPDPAANGDGSTSGTIQEEDDDDLILRLAQPDYSLVNLPTTLRVPKFKSAFRVTHRFSRPLGEGSFGNLVEDLFGLDSGAFIGLEYRFGLLPGTQIGVSRNNGKTIELFGQYDAVRQERGSPVTIDARLGVEGRDNFRESYSPAVSAVISRTIGTTAALYAIPTWVGNTNPLPSELAEDDDTFLVGLAARLRIRRTVYLVAEMSPRLAGFDPGVTQISFGLEKRAGGHLFQVNFSNDLGLTPGDIARGARSYDDWFLGFNISRKFF